MISSLKLAKLCGVSQGTIDRALHDRGEISAATKARILRAAARYGYRPHPAARELIQGTSCSVGAILPLSSVFFLDLFAEIKRALAAHRLRLLLCPVSDAPEFLEVLEDFAARRCCAAIVVPPEEKLSLPATLTRDLRLMTILNPCRGLWHIGPDEERTGREGVAHLRRRGHERILHLRYARKSSAMEARARGYARGMRECGLRPKVLVEPVESELLVAVRKERATALFCHNDWLALSAIRSLEHHGIAVPGQVSVLGVDASPTFRAFYPELASLQYPFAQVAAEAARVAAGGNARRSPSFASLPLVEGKTVAIVVGADLQNREI